MKEEITDMSLTRQMTKLDMEKDRIRMFGWTRCDFCKRERGNDMHEIVSRARTIQNMHARELSMDKHVCNLLCSNCHLNGAIYTRDGYDTLIESLYELYGEDEVRAHFKKIPLPYLKGIILP